MSEPDSWWVLAKSWGLARDNVVQSVEARVSAVRWRHNLPAFGDASLDQNTLVFMLKPGVSQLHRGGRPLDAARERGGLGLIPKGAYGSWTFQTSIDVLHVYLPDALLSELGDQIGARGSVSLSERLQLQDPVLPSLAQEVVHAMEAGEDSKLYIDSLGVMIGARLVREHSSASAPTSSVYAGGLAGWQVRRAKDFLLAHLHRDVSLAEVAAAVRLSPYHFARAFKTSLGVTPNQWLTEQRMTRAQGLLANPKSELDEVARAVGYGSPRAFAAAFRRSVGAPPAAWRRRRLA